MYLNLRMKYNKEMDELKTLEKNPRTPSTDIRGMYLYYYDQYLRNLNFSFMNFILNNYFELYKPVKEILNKIENN